jgi:hypothetical protein
MSTVDYLQGYNYRGARAMVLLHERYMQEFLDVWRRAKAAKLKLPHTNDPDYHSLDTLLVHVLRSSRNYMIWMCEKLQLPDPKIELPPEPELVEVEAGRFLIHLLLRWSAPLAQVDEQHMSRPSYKSNWGMDYSIDSMLEHAVLHPVRHTFQLEELLQQPISR